MIAESRKQNVADIPAPPFAFEQNLDGTQDAVRGALAMFLDRLAPLPLSDDEIGVVELVMAETLNNIVEHAFRDHPQPGLIRIRCQYHSNNLYLRITDLGDAMPNSVLPQPKGLDIDVAVEDLPEGGFGWGLIRALTGDVSYARSGPMNITTMRVPVGTA